MAQTQSTPWILSAVQAALADPNNAAAGGGGGGGGGAINPLTTPRPKVVQVTSSGSSEEDRYLEVSDAETKVAVFLTPRAREQFRQAVGNEERTLRSLRSCMVKLEKWVVTYLPLAKDSARHRLAHDREFVDQAPICLLALEFSLVGLENLGTFGQPRPLNNNAEVKQRCREIPSVPALLTQLATAQHLARLPDCNGEDTLPDPVDEGHPLVLEEVLGMLVLQEEEGRIGKGRQWQGQQ